MFDHRGGNVNRMIARPNDPYVAVYVLSEFIFCPRAAIVALEKDEEQDEPVRQPRLDYVPRLFVEYHIIQAIKSASLYLLIALGVGLGLIAAIYFCWGLLPCYGVIGMVIASFVALSLALAMWTRLQSLLPQWWAAKSAAPKEPNPSSTDRQAVNWWEMRKSGYEAVQYRDKLSDEQWRLVGRPWRVLRKGGYRIPVFRMRGGGTKLRPQHYVRMAAYCRLLEVSEGAQSPYGIVLFPDSYSGETVPNAPWSRSMFHSALVNLRNLIASNRTPPAPEFRRCKQCPLGRPIVYRPGETETMHRGVPLPVFGRTGVDDHTYHSACGDKFRWIPPHDRASEKQLFQDNSNDDDEDDYDYDDD